MYTKPIAIGIAVTIVIALLLGMFMPNGIGFSGWFPAVFFGVFTAYILANLAGNKRVIKADPAQRDRALQFQPTPGKAQLVVMRQGFMGRAAGMNITVDGVLIGQIKSPQFTSFEINPGIHNVSLGLGGLAAKQNNNAEHQFEIGAGGVVILSATLSMGVVKNSINIQRLDPSPQTAQILGKIPMILPDPN